jgi:hypothetical protein
VVGGLGPDTGGSGYRSRPTAHFHDLWVSQRHDDPKAPLRHGKKAEAATRLAELERLAPKHARIGEFRARLSRGDKLR